MVTIVQEDIKVNSPERFNTSGIILSQKTSRYSSYNHTLMKIKIFPAFDFPSVLFFRLLK